MSKLKRFIIWVFLGMRIAVAVGQSPSLQLRLLPIDAPPEALQKVKYKANCSDSLAVVTELRSVIQQLQQQQYLEASVDTLAATERLYTAFLHLGPQYRWAYLSGGNVDEGLLSASGFRERMYRGAPFSYWQVSRLRENLLQNAENNGYPFASVGLDSVGNDNGTLTARLTMDKGPFVAFRKIKIEGTAVIADTYLTNYLGIKPGAPYDRSRVLRLRERLRELPFVTMTKDPLIVFGEEGADVQLFLDRRNSSRFDFVIGVLPNSRQVGRLLITGSFNGELQNQFGRGERIFARFEQLRPQTQRLDLRFAYPYLLGLPFGADVQFNLYKRDTNYIDIEYDLGAQYLLEGGNYLKVFWNNRRTNLLSINETLIRQRNALPDTLDVTYSSFGLEYSLQRLDYRYNPRKGWSFFGRAGAGVKRIRRNTQIEAFGIEGLYDSLTLRSFQYRLVGQVEGFVPLFKRSTLKAGLQTGIILSATPPYANEQFRIGGNRLLRGFDEEFVFATNYEVLTLEYRLLLGQNSYLNVFGDLARVDNVTANTAPTTSTVDYPKGIGAGITFETRAGLFGISLAFGARGQENFDFGAPKVHFGYVSVF